MSRILLDTSAYSAFMRGQEGAKVAIQEASEIVLTPVVLGELRAGFLRGTRRRRNEALLARFQSSARVRSVAIDDETSQRYAAVLHALRKAGTPISANDVWIAASAMQHGLRVVTTDPDFERVPQILVERLRVD